MVRREAALEQGKMHIPVPVRWLVALLEYVTGLCRPQLPGRPRSTDSAYVLNVALIC